MTIDNLRLSRTAGFSHVAVHHHAAVFRLLFFYYYIITARFAYRNIIFFNLSLKNRSRNTKITYSYIVRSATPKYPCADRIY